MKKYDQRIRSYARKWLGLEHSGLNGILLKQILGAVERMEKVIQTIFFLLLKSDKLFLFSQSKFDEEMEAVATTGLFPPANKVASTHEIDAKYNLLQLAARAASPPGATAAAAPLNRASYPQVDSGQQLIYRGLNNARTTPYGQVMSYAGISRPFESPQVIKRDDLGKTKTTFHPIFSLKLTKIFRSLIYYIFYSS